jgi:hypothetical protein
LANKKRTFGRGREREGPRAGQGRGRAEKEWCLLLDEEVDQVVQAALGHQYVVGIVDSGVTRVQGRHRAHGQGLLVCLAFASQFLSKESHHALFLKILNGKN